MRKLVTALALLAAAIWSAVIWGGYALLGWTGDFVAQNAGALALPAEAVEVAVWARILAESFGQGAAMVLWLLGLGLIAIAMLAVNLVIGRFAPAGRQQFGQPLAPQQPVTPPAPTQAPPSAPAWGRQTSR